MEEWGKKKTHADLNIVQHGGYYSEERRVQEDIGGEMPKGEDMKEGKVRRKVRREEKNTEETRVKRKDDTGREERKREERMEEEKGSELGRREEKKKLQNV